MINDSHLFISKNILPIYIRKKIEDINNLDDIPVFILHLGLIYLSITIFINLSVKKDCVYLIKLLLVLKSAIK